MNCAYSIYQMTEDELKKVFPADGQDIEFIEDLFARMGNESVYNVLAPSWSREIKRSEVIGIRGTLFYELEYKRQSYPKKKSSDIDSLGNAVLLQND